MARAGLQVDALRMCLDRSYAFEQLALAHAGDIPNLRQCALDLFATLDRKPGRRAGRLIRPPTPGCVGARAACGCTMSRTRRAGGRR